MSEIRRKLVIVGDGACGKVVCSLSTVIYEKQQLMIFHLI